MAMTRSQFQRFLFDGIREVIFKKYREIPLRYTSIFNVLTSQKAFEEDNQIAGAGLLVRTPENSGTPEDAMLPGFPKRYQHNDYRLKVGASMQLRRDERTGFWRDRASDLGYSTRQTKEILHAGYIDSGFTTSLGPDGVSLYSAVHPNIKQGTQSNIIALNSTLTVVGYRLALQQFRRFFDDTGVRRVQLMPSLLWVPPELEYDALEIVNSTQRPDTANRADNVAKGKTSVFVWEYLLDTNAWGINCDKGVIKLKSFNRTDMEVDRNEDWDTEIDHVRVKTAFSFGHSHWIGTLASNPV